MRPSQPSHPQSNRSNASGSAGNSNYNHSRRVGALDTSRTRSPTSRGSSGNQQGSNSYPGKNLPELTIKLRGLPLEIITWDLWRTFRKEGKLVFAEFFEDRQGVRDGSGRVRFSPPPEKQFWKNGQYMYTNEEQNASCWIQVSLDESRKNRKYTVQSPIERYIFYPEQMALNANKFHFGFMLDPSSMMSMQEIEAKASKNLSFTVDLLRKKIVSKFEVEITDPRRNGSNVLGDKEKIGHWDRLEEFKFELPFDQVKMIHRMELRNHQYALVISLQSPPRVFRFREGLKPKDPKGTLSWSENDSWYRQTDILYSREALKDVILSLHYERPVIDIGRWTTYLWVFNRSQRDDQLYEQIKAALQDYNIEIRMQEKIQHVAARDAPLWALIDSPKALADSATDVHSLAAFGGAISLPFDVRYQVEVCISKDLLNEHNITKDFISALASKDPTKAKYMLEYVAEQNKRIYDPMTIFEDREALTYFPRTEIPHYCAYQRKATITPSKIIFSSPSVETTNRVLRHYARENEEGRFLRVQFTDEESEGRINSSIKETNDEIYTRVYRTLYNGIRIGDRHYQFLAFGNSQFRENGAYFFSPTDHLSCDDIREWMGNFSHINVVAKYAARLGQCFSTTRAINGLSKPMIVPIKDIERNGYNFTDGVGKISPFLAKMISSELGLSTDRPPSAFQFRLGGCKGMLVVWDDATHNQVHIRKSQQKFTAIYNGLEIVRCSRFSNATLNRQTISIMSALGVPNDVFIDMMSVELEDYQTAMSDSDLAVQMLSRHIDDNQMTINIASMLLNGFMTAGEPFVMSLLHLWRSWSIKLLKEKAKINVEKGAFVFGCIDETATLKGYTTPAPGKPVSEDDLPEIFIQVPLDREDRNYRRYVVIEGICLVGRNPSLHPGDLRVVRAVNVPALQHLRDVVVFPQNGDRDVPSMCSGGDLDGDDFFVIWDEKLLPRDRNCDPMDHTPVPPIELNREVKVHHLLKFFVRYMKNDSLPTIAHAHMAQADYRRDGVKDPICLELADLHSRAVDYVKTGQPAEMRGRLRPRMWPHFMEKKHKSKEQIYHSTKVLGKLYDRVEKVDFAPQYKVPFDKRILRAYELDGAMLKTARQIKSQYDIAMRRIMAQQDIQTEFEVWSTFILSRPKIGSDYKVQEQMKFVTDDLKSQFRSMCIEKAGGKDFSVLGSFVAAMYRVTKEELDIALAECKATKNVGGYDVPKRKMEPRSMPFISFPWLFERDLGRIATGTEQVDLDDLGLPTFTRSHTRKRQAAPVADDEDFVERKDGVIIHRGEELDLFRSDPESDYSGESDYEHARVRDRRVEAKDQETTDDLTLSDIDAKEITSESAADVSRSSQSAESSKWQKAGSQSADDISPISLSVEDVSSASLSLAESSKEEVEEVEEVEQIDDNKTPLQKLAQLVITEEEKPARDVNLSESSAAELEEMEEEETEETDVAKSSLEKLAEIVVSEVEEPESDNASLEKLPQTVEA